MLPGNDTSTVFVEVAQVGNVTLMSVGKFGGITRVEYSIPVYCLRCDGGRV